VKWLQDLKKECTGIDEFMELASQRANVALVAAAVEAAVGYDYEEIKQEYMKVHKGYDDNNEPIIVEIPGKRTTNKKHTKKDGSMLKFLLINRLPDYFSDTKKFEINKKTVELKGVTEEEIKGFAGKLLTVIKERKVVDSEFVETEK